MGDGGQLTGHVESIAARIEDRDRAEGSNLLANVNPTFNWVRLAQRVPARIALDPTPDPARLVAGRSATVEVIDRQASVSSASSKGANFRNASNG
jgi:multidrug resistance efflux pump